MEIIRDETGGLFMIPLFVSWHVRRCNVKGCQEKPTTIITKVSKEAPVFGMCEDHYQAAKARGQFRYTLVFDDYDAFNQSPSARPHLSPDDYMTGVTISVDRVQRIVTAVSGVKCPPTDQHLDTLKTHMKVHAVNAHACLGMEFGELILMTRGVHFHYSMTYEIAKRD